MALPDKVYLREQECASGVYEGTKDNGKLYLSATPARKAATDLLAALKMALPELKFSLQEGGHDPSVGIDARELIAAIEYAEAAIAKATV